VLKGKRDLRVDRPSLLSFYDSGSDIEMECQVFLIALVKIRFLLTGSRCGTPKLNDWEVSWGSGQLPND
jgi:hypothetical protein